MIYEFKGFNPSDHAREYVAMMAEKLYYNAPSDAGLKLVFEKTKDMIRASCRIAAQVGVFTADVVTNNIYSAANQIEENINFQLNQWKKYRFHKNKIVNPIEDPMMFAC
jgi:ribosome-associated translation inhibitor RaiA